MGVARHYYIQVCLRDIDQCLPEMMEKVEYLEYLVLQEQPYVDRHLVVPRPSGVELAAKWADLLGEPRLHCHVDVFHRGRELDFALGNLFFNGLEAICYLFTLFFSEDACSYEHHRVGDGAQNVELVKPLVERDGGVKLFNELVCPLPL